VCRVGHSTYRQASEFATRVGAKVFVPFHHDPSHTDEVLDQLLANATEQLKSACRVGAAYEGATFEVGL
jgi:ribonuclease BN (tRNA processing enzyme)